MIQSYYGNGKGKTTTAVGCAIRSLGSGQRVLFVQLLKNNESSEFSILNDLDNLDILKPDERYELFDNLKKERTELLSETYNKLLFEDLTKNNERYQMIILDEIFDIIEFEYVSEDMLLELVNLLKEHSEIILTGHILPDKIALVSDYISEIREINHPYKKGVPSRKGIEY